MTSITDSVRYLKGVGPQMAQRLARLGIESIQDVLFHLPLRYEDRTRVMPLGSIRPGLTALIEAEVEHAEVVFRPRRSLICRMADGTGAITLRFFHFNQQQQESFKRGQRLRCYGLVRQRGRQFEMIHPEYQMNLESIEPTEDNLTPVYPATEGVQQRTLRRIADQALALLREQASINELLPDGVLDEYGYPNLFESIEYIHKPPPDASVQLLTDGIHPCQQRFAFEELLAHHLSLLQLRKTIQRDHAPPVSSDGHLQQQFIERLPFELTDAQLRVIDEINADLKTGVPCMRLVQGDVGSGKTVVAVAAALRVIEVNLQAAIMAPTELLAEQHYQNFMHWLKPLNINVAWLTGRMKTARRLEVLQGLQEGTVQLVVGTHALFQDDVEFNRLALIVVDEQHRFGVHQRLALRNKGAIEQAHPHQIIMTATPIPRTLAMTAYADLDYSIIDQLPKNRLPIKTVVLSNERRHDVIERIKQACLDGKQAYWVCTLIEESEVLQCEAAEDTTETLKQMLPDIRIALVHGRMKGVEKEQVMADFKNGDVQLLVATTVVEVGVDVPRASLMIIENAERLGLSQLHQLRGRVGRSTIQSSCVLLYQAPLSKKARTRLDAIRQSNDGFEIAKQDLVMRGPGEVLGTRQAGLIDFRIADINRDEALLPNVKAAAHRLFDDHAERVQMIIDRWVGQKQHFRKV